jgi:hypothetical protein
MSTENEKTNITIVFDIGKEESYSGSLKSILSGLPEEPLCFIIESDIFYYNKNVAEAFKSGEISENELKKTLQASGIYRNKSEIIGTNGISIDEGELWILKGNKIILYDDDLFVEAVFSPTSFKRIK